MPYLIDQIKEGDVFDHLTAFAAQYKTVITTRETKQILHVACLCFCGTVVLVKPANLVRRIIKSCGCKGRPGDYMLGKTVGKFTVVGKEENICKDGKPRTFWVCQCECGTVVKRCASKITNTIAGKQCKTCYEKEVRPGQAVGEITSTYWNRLRRGAEKRNFAFDVTVEFARDLFLKQNRKCALSGQHLEFSPKARSQWTTASFDRIDSTVGYIPNNVQWVHKNINMFKIKLPEPEFIRLCALVTDYHRSSISAVNLAPMSLLGSVEV